MHGYSFQPFPLLRPSIPIQYHSFQLVLAYWYPATNLRLSVVDLQGPESLFGRCLCLVVPVSRSVRPAFTDFERNTEQSIDILVKPHFEALEE